MEQHIALGSRAPTSPALWDLRATCQALVNSRASVMTAASLSAELTGAPGETLTLRALSEELAELHSFDVTFEAADHSFTVRFSRKAGGSELPSNTH